MGKPTGMSVAPGPGGGQFDFVECPPGGIGTAAASTTANMLYGGRVMVHRPLTVDQMHYVCNVSSGNVELAIYTYDGTTWTKVATTGAVASSGGSSAITTVALTAPYTLQPFVVYYLTIAADNGTITIARTSTHLGINLKNRGILRVTSYPLPASFTTIAAAAGVEPWLAASAA